MSTIGAIGTKPDCDYKSTITTKLNIGRQKASTIDINGEASESNVQNEQPS